MSIITLHVGATESKWFKWMITVSSRYSWPDRRQKITALIWSQKKVRLSGRQRSQFWSNLSLSRILPAANLVLFQTWPQSFPSFLQLSCVASVLWSKLLQTNYGDGLFRVKRMFFSRKKTMSQTSQNTSFLRITPVWNLVVTNNKLELIKYS